MYYYHIHPPDCPKSKIAYHLYFFLKARRGNPKSEPIEDPFTK